MGPQLKNTKFQKNRGRGGGVGGGGGVSPRVGELSPRVRKFLAPPLTTRPRLTWWQNNSTAWTTNHRATQQRVRNMASGFVLPPPPPLEIHDTIASEKWKNFRLAWSNCLLVTELNKKPEAVQVATLLTVIGEEARDVYSTFTDWAEEGDDGCKVFYGYYHGCKVFNKFK